MNIKDIIIAFLLSALLVGGYHMFFGQKHETKASNNSNVITDISSSGAGAAGAGGGSAGGASGSVGQSAPKVMSDEEALITMQTPNIKAQIDLRGGYISNLELLKYPATTDKDSPPVTLLEQDVYIAQTGLISRNKNIQLPSAGSIWSLKTQGKNAENKETIVMTWKSQQKGSSSNGNGLEIERTIVLEKPYVFSITDKITNNSNKQVQLLPYGRIYRMLKKQVEDFFIFHEGFLGNFDNALKEVDYSDLDDEKEFYKSNQAWIGNTDKYWLTTLGPRSGQATVQAKYYLVKPNTYQADYLMNEISINAGATGSLSHIMFSGPKIPALLDKYQSEFGIENLHNAIDWGWFSPFVKGLFYIIKLINDFVGNFGISIVILTILIKIIIFPLTLSSMKNSQKMKAIAPEMKRIKTMYANKRELMAQEIGKMYKKHDISIISTVLPILVQIPVFFSMYKMLLISIDMRHAPFLFWIKDLAAKDPTNIFTLFGLINWSPPDFLHVGIWPIMVGVTFYFQQKLGGQAMPQQNKIFSKMMQVLPVMMTFILAAFPAGLMIYWSITNLLGIIQQLVINRWFKNDNNKQKAS